MHKLCLISIISVLVSFNAYSQTTDLTLNQAWEKAYQNYPELKEKNALINAARYNTLRVKSDMLPNTQIQLQNSYGTYKGIGGAFFPLPGVFNVNGNSPNDQIKTTVNSFGSVLVDWNIYQFGRLRHSIGAVNSLTTQAKGEFEWKGKLKAAKLKLSEFISDLGTNLSLKDDFYLKRPEDLYNPDSINNHPLLNVLEQQVIYEQLQQKIESRKLLPAVSLLGGASYRGSGIGTSGVNNSLTSGFKKVNKLRLLVAIPEKHAASVNDHTKVSFTVTGLPGKVFQSTIARTSSVLQKSTRSMIIEFDVSNHQGLNGGEYAQIKLQLQRPDSTYWVPASSVVNTQAGVFAVKLNNGIIERVPVIIGGRNADKLEVFGDFTTSENIVKIGSEELTEGTKANIK